MTDLVQKLLSLSADLAAADEPDAARIALEAAKEARELVRLLAIHEERLPRVSEAAEAEARWSTRPSRGAGEPSADWA